jgi:cytidylate kinase
MSIVAMTREIGSLGTYIAQETARRLGYNFVRQEIIVEAARRHEADPRVLEATVEAKPKAFESRQGAARRNFSFVAAEVLNVALKDNVVILGRWSTLLLRGVEHVLRVRVCAPLPVRARRLAEQMRLSPVETAERIRRADEGIHLRMRQFFDIAWEDPREYDLTLNTERLSVAEAAETVVGMAGLPSRQPTEESRTALWDAALAARIRAALKAGVETAHLDLTIRCDGGRTDLTGTVPEEEDRERVGRIAAGYAGVRAVENRLVVTRMPVH